MRMEMSGHDNAGYIRKFDIRGHSFSTCALQGVGGQALCVCQCVVIVTSLSVRTKWVGGSGFLSLCVRNK